MLTNKEQLSEQTLEWNMNMPSLSCRLESVSPVVFLEDIRVGTNYRSFPDTQILRKMTFLFFWLVPWSLGVLWANWIPRDS